MEKEDLFSNLYFYRSLTDAGMNPAIIPYMILTGALFQKRTIYFSICNAIFNRWSIELNGSKKALEIHDSCGRRAWKKKTFSGMTPNYKSYSAYK